MRPRSPAVAFEHVDARVSLDDPRARGRSCESCRLRHVAQPCASGWLPTTPRRRWRPPSSACSSVAARLADLELHRLRLLLGGMFADAVERAAGALAIASYSRFARMQGGSFSSSLMGLLLAMISAPLPRLRQSAPRVLADLRVLAVFGPTVVRQGVPGAVVRREQDVVGEASRDTPSSAPTGVPRSRPRRRRRSGSARIRHAVAGEREVQDRAGVILRSQLLFVLVVAPRLRRQQPGCHGYCRTGR